jgi:hypothetical protein
LGGQPHLVVLDVGATDVSHDDDVGVGGEPAGQLAQGGVGDVDARGARNVVSCTR